MTWAGGKANRVAVIAGSNPGVTERVFHSAWYPGATHTITLSVPQRYRTLLGANTGNPVWIKVVQTNSTAPSFAATSSVARAYRASPAGVWTLAGSAVADHAGQGGQTLRVAELNVQSVSASAQFSSANRWAARLPRVAAQVKQAAPDVLLTAELSTSLLSACTNHPGAGEPYLCRGKTQLASLQANLPQLQLADADAYDRVLDLARSAAAPGTITSGAHVFYDPAKFQLLAHGFFSPALSPSESFADVQGLGVPNFARQVGTDRWLAWAKLESKAAPHRQFYAVAAHFSAGKGAAVSAARTAEAKLLAPALQKLTGSTPVVLGGDFNTDATRDALPVQPVLMAAGWADAAAVAKAARTGLHFQTCNVSAPSGTDVGYGPAPLASPFVASRIDYILLRGALAPVSYQNVLHLRADGTFLRALTGSDHNLQLATLALR